MDKIYDLFVSGGRDSVASALIARDRAESENVRYRVVFIDTLFSYCVPSDIEFPRALDYVKEFSKWLGAELVVLRPEVDYWECVKKWGYPALLRKRWCFKVLKMNPIKKFIERERLVEKLDPVYVVGIRRSESRMRKKYTKELTVMKIGRFRVKYWYPILYFSKTQVEEVIKKYNPPRNPLWDSDMSLECICLAGSSRKYLDYIIVNYPELAKWLAEKDKEIQRERKDPLLPVPLKNLKIPLHKYVEMKLKEKRITDFIYKEEG